MFNYFFFYNFLEGIGQFYFRMLIYLPTPRCHHCFHHEIRDVRFEDLHNNEIGIEPLDAHPCNSGQDKEVDHSCKEPTWSWRHPRAASLGYEGVEKKHHQK